jgi:NADPH:quinone reductase-like Zn-dependent oxidoreductase
MAKIVRMHEYGDASVLKIDDITVPEPADDEVQIRVKAIGLNRAEVMFRNHAYLQEAVFPSRLGYEASGVVEVVGASVASKFRIGDRVSIIPALDIARWGTYGEIVNIPARQVVRHPENISFTQAAASWMQYVTAWGALIEQAKITQDDFIIVTAASSSVGLAAIQIANLVGSTVIAVTRTRAKEDALFDVGAHHVICTQEENIVDRVMEITHNDGARVAFDPIAGPLLEQLTQCMAKGGILLEYGALSPDASPFPLFSVLGKTLTLKGYLYSEIVGDDKALEHAKEFILDGLASERLLPVIARTFPFEQIQDAHRFLESNEQVGKIVVTL